MKTNAITVELDEQTRSSLDHLCKTWRVAPEEAMKRAIRQSDEPAPKSSPEERLAAWREWQRVAQMTPEKAEARKAAIHDARR